MSSEMVFEADTVCKSYPENAEPLVTVELTVPKVSGLPPRACARINRFYADVVKAQLRYAKNGLLARARKAARLAAAAGETFTPYLLDVRFETRCLEKPVLSLTWDLTETAGAATPRAVRYVDNWNAQTGLPVRWTLTRKQRRAVLEQCRGQLGDGAEFFRDARRAVRRFFKPDNCYASADGVGVVYQLYTLGPYDKGFPTFMVRGSMS